MIRPWMPTVIGFVIALVAGWFLFPVLLYESRDQPVQFSHAIHTGEAVGMGCEDCHAIRDDGTFAGMPPLEQCISCHAEMVGESDRERVFVEEYVQKNREIPWNVYAGQPDNAFFSHAIHVRKAGIECGQCHGDHGITDSLRRFEVNRISGYSRDIWGSSIGGWSGGMKMDDCIDCHGQHDVKTACLNCHK
jgi:hypothetical protein